MYHQKHTSAHLGEDVKEGVRVGVDHWRDVRDAARHVRLHDPHLDRGANQHQTNLKCARSAVFIFGATVSLSYSLVKRLSSSYFLVERLSLSYFLVKRLSLSYFLVEVAFSIGRLHLLVHRPPHQLSLERIEFNSLSTLLKSKLLLVQHLTLTISDLMSWSPGNDQQRT